jgi:hypothetical protein
MNVIGTYDDNSTNILRHVPVREYSNILMWGRNPEIAFLRKPQSFCVLVMPCHVVWWRMLLDFPLLCLYHCRISTLFACDLGLGEVMWGAGCHPPYGLPVLNWLMRNTPVHRYFRYQYITNPFCRYFWCFIQIFQCVTTPVDIYMYIWIVQWLDTSGT